MAIKWDSRLATGLDWQDEEHQAIFARIDRLLEAMIHNEARSELEGLFEFLESYAVEHFEHEQQFMLDNDFPGYGPHKVAHEQFCRQFQDLKLSHTRQGASSFVVMRVQRWLSDWLLNHICQMDKELATYLNQRA